MSNEILVIGATGKVGRHVVAALTAQGESVRPAGRTLGATGVAFDWDRPETWAPALDKVERAYLVLPQGTERPDPQVGEFLTTAASTGLRRIVLLSAYGFNHDHSEASGMRAAEKLVESSGLDWTILRPNWFLQNFSEGFLNPAVQGGSIYAPAGTGAVSFVDTRDTAEVAVVALTADGHAGAGYTITGSQSFTFGDVADAIAAAAGHAVNYVAITLEQAREGLVGAGIDPDYADSLLLLYANISAGLNASVTDVVERVTGHEPRDLAAFIRENAATWA
jgi:uncharacterized protein YbjT (DUF2867 family)